MVGRDLSLWWWPSCLKSFSFFFFPFLQVNIKNVDKLLPPTGQGQKPRSYQGHWTSRCSITHSSCWSFFWPLAQSAQDTYWLKVDLLRLCSRPFGTDPASLVLQTAVSSTATYLCSWWWKYINRTKTEAEFWRSVSLSCHGTQMDLHSPVWSSKPVHCLQSLYSTWSWYLFTAIGP